MPTLYLIDAHAYLHRAYHALPPLSNSEGQPVNAIYGFMRMLVKIIRQYKPDYMAVCFDHAAPTFRHEAYADYKATRKETDASLVSQFPIARDATAAMNLASFEKAGFEADDIIAHLTREGRKQGWNVVIVSGDKDALQLVGDGVQVLNEMKNILYDVPQVVARYGVLPTQIPEIFSLMGDTSDNVPGVPGIGEKTAVKLIQEHGDLEHLLASVSTIKGKTGELLKEHAAQARQCRALVLLDQPVPLEIDWNACAVGDLPADRLVPFLQKMEFFALMKDMLPNLNANIDTSKREYDTILTEAELSAWVAKAKRSERLAVDVETDGLDPRHANLVGVSMAYKAGAACYIPLRHHGLGVPAQLDLPTLQKHLLSLFAGSRPQLYGHNLKFDAMILQRHGLPLGQLHCDTMVASYVLNPSRTSHGLKDLVLEWVGERMTPIEELIGKGAKQTTMDQVPIDRAAPYACADADMTLRLAEIFEKLIQEKGLQRLFYDLEMPLISILAKMEDVGIRVDTTYLSELGVTFRKRSGELELSIYEHAGGPFNINSPKQLASILFEKLNLPIQRRTKTGISTDEEVLQKLSSLHPMPKTLIEYRELQKLHSTYIEGLQAAAQTDDGRIHSSFNQTVAATGRLSSSNPNLQNIPIRSELGRLIRKGFVAREGHTLLSADYSQIDLRMLAHMSSDLTMVAAFKNGEDIHTQTAAEIFGVAHSEVSSELRRVAKSINFGIVYGISAFGLAQQLQIPADQAKGHIQRYFEKYPGVKAWIESTLNDARDKGFVRTLLGRIRYLPEIQSKNSQIRGFAERMAMNTPIQGTSADVIKLAMLRLVETQATRAWEGHMLVQVHDELLFEVPDEALPSAQKTIKNLMENVLPLSIPVIVDLKTGRNWSEMAPVGKKTP
jgi:DNA polymerase I